MDTQQKELTVIGCRIKGISEYFLGEGEIIDVVTEMEAVKETRIENFDETTDELTDEFFKLTHTFTLRTPLYIVQPDNGGTLKKLFSDEFTLI